jgi:hypothetical protein
MAAGTGTWGTRLPGTVMALRPVPGIDQCSATTRTGRFRVKVAPGVYAVIMSRRKGAKRAVTAKVVREGGTHEPLAGRPAARRGAAGVRGNITARTVWTCPT